MLISPTSFSFYLLQFREDELGTDPNNRDTDGDGLEDGYEVNTSNTNPLQKEPTNLPTAVRLTFSFRFKLFSSSSLCLISSRFSSTTHYRVPPTNLQ